MIMTTMETLVEELKHHIATATPEQLERERAFLQSYADSDSPNVYEYIEWLKQCNACYEKQVLTANIYNHHNPDFMMDCGFSFAA